MARIDRLKSMKDIEIQGWLRRIEPEDLQHALLGLDQEIRAKVLSNMSPRANQVIKEYLTKSHSPTEMDNISNSIVRIEKQLS